MARPSKKQEREAAEAAWNAEQARVEALGNLFSALPECGAKLALQTAMRDRVIDLYNESHFERGDVLLEFLPNKFARELLDWYFPDDQDAEPTQPPPSPTGEYETAQQGQVQSAPQQPCRAHGNGAGEANAEILTIARDLVSLWQNPNIQGLPRAERNAAIEETREKLIAAVSR